jgi:hypothetical protein
MVCLEMRAGELIRRLILGELTKYEVVRTSSEPLQQRSRHSTVRRAIPQKRHLDALENSPRIERYTPFMMRLKIQDVSFCTP